MHKQEEYIDEYKPELGADITQTVVLKNGVIVIALDNDMVAVDVNGTKKPNIISKDIYFFELNNNNGNLAFDYVLYDKKNCKKDGVPANNLGCAYDYSRRYREP